MARTPRASLSKTSGQGVSRYSYQRAYGMTHDDGARVGAVKGIDSDIGNTSGRSYGKTAMGSAGYGDTPGLPKDIADVEELGRLKPAKSSAGVARTRAKKLK